jgi:hypothetical protein
MNGHTQGKSMGTFLSMVIMIFVGGLILAQATGAMMGGKSPQSPVAQKAFDAAAYSYCIAEQALANAKLGDYFDGFVDLSNEDILRLKEKKENECTFQ